ncbi:MAG TPA: hypothetical protein VL240_07075 [Candidatus Binatia bacterium]|nr:hypothetical protein [Candidatus Binatia bacterium]
MLDAFLVPFNSVVTAKGDSEALDISGAANPVFLLTLSVGSIVEQESIELSVFTSADGATWETKPVASLPQKFYVGEYPLLVDLSAQPNAKFLRAHWEVTRWGRGPTTPRFEIAVRVREVSREALHEATAEAQTRR